MRVIGGNLRSRIINAPIGDNTRPTSDKTRQAIFNIISSYVYDANVLDIFSGSGAFSIEAISRGASKSTLIDLNIEAIKTINENITNLKIKDKCSVIQDDYRCINTLNDSYDIIFLDPPYKMDVFDEILSIIDENKLLKDNGVIVYESNEEHSLKKEYVNYRYKVYKYGIAFVNILYKC